MLEVKIVNLSICSVCAVSDNRNLDIAKQNFDVVSSDVNPNLQCEKKSGLLEVKLSWLLCHFVTSDTIHILPGRSGKTWLCG